MAKLSQETKANCSKYNVLFDTQQVSKRKLCHLQYVHSILRGTHMWNTYFYYVELGRLYYEIEF